MKKVVIIGCGAYMDAGYGCPGEWKCLKAAALGEGKFSEPSQIIAFVKCECPGRATVANAALAIKSAEIKPDQIYLTKCMVEAKPGCPYIKPEEMAEMLTQKTGIPVILGTHEYG